MEKTFHVFGHEKTLKRTVNLFKKAIKHQKVLVGVNATAGASMEEENFDPTIFTEAQLKIIDLQVKYVAETFKISEEVLQDADPTEVVDTVNAIYNFATGAGDSGNESGEQ